jgi:hypothetical protein
MTLGEYLSMQTSRPWEWGRQDCCTFPADWVLAITGMDPLAEWRGRYSTESEAELLIAEAGGLIGLCSNGLTGILRRVDVPEVGAVGLIKMVGTEHQIIDIGAIFTGKRWSFRSPRGIGALSLPPENVVAIWGR